MARRAWNKGAALAVLLVAACAPQPTSPPAPVGAPPPPGLRLEAINFSALPDWRTEDHGGAVQAVKRSCPVLETKAPAPAVARLSGGVADWRPICAAAGRLAPGPAAARRFFEDWFRPFAATDGGRADLITGYYEPELLGSRTRGSAYQVPLYAPPPDLASARQPYFSRDEIERGALAGRNLEIVWLADPVDAFFLHVQGSGRVRLPDGRVLRVGFAGSNNHAYVAIGRELVRDGQIPEGEATAPRIRAWLAANPDRRAEMLARNPRFIFFRITEGDGPVGAQGVALTPGRSLAVDPTHLPLGIPLWLDAVDPLNRMPMRRLVVAQDTGNAIRGPVRADLFLGAGQDAETRAGVMRDRGRLYLLVPKTAPIAAGS